MKKILMKTSYRNFYKPGDVVDEDNTKADELVRLGRAEFVEVEVKAPMNKEINTLKTGKNIFKCDTCSRVFANERGLKTHSARAHK